jgi:hypothetical protein
MFFLIFERLRQYENKQSIRSHELSKCLGDFSKNNETRHVIGGSVFLLLLKIYPENTALKSQTDTPVFKLVQLDEVEPEEMSPQAFADSFS